ncbi:MAG: biosynthetic arginine decarboxylase [Candidatus Tectomicrobia bacterium]|nr:biosynthetic arginine decarboxylase [Candidatus Tectomicrobia bacterium]
MKKKFFPVETQASTLWSVVDSSKLYGIEKWGAGYFDLNRKGHVVVKPTKHEDQTADLKEIVDTLLQRKLSLPLLLRFPQILETQVNLLNECFRSAIREFDYDGAYLGVFPLKVNQTREVAEELHRAGRKYNLGFEVGSKAELFATLQLQSNPHSLLLCNGFKDEKFIYWALVASKLGKKVVLTVERLEELEKIIEFSKKLNIQPMIGLRIELYSKGSGRWESSGGQDSKFGLSIAELLHGIAMLSESDLLESLKMLHFHIGSQITEIKRVQNAVKEAARVYAKIKKMGLGVEYLNVGGGLGVDYDGSKTSFDSSINYSVQEYCNNVVYSIGEVCKSENVERPIIVTESGRALTAYHAVLITNVIGEVRRDYQFNGMVSEGMADVVQELNDILKSINVKNYREYYHDALQSKEELVTLFNLGYLSLEERALGETLFRKICKKVAILGRQANNLTDELLHLTQFLASKYVCNFSLFQSLPDNWAIDQLFPILPIHRLNEPPNVHATLVDITCDSDGKVDQFIDVKEIKTTLLLHSWKDEPYYIGFFLVGAYQDALGDFHNLFGTVNEAIISIDGNGHWSAKKIYRGNSIHEILRFASYSKPQLQRAFLSQVEKCSKNGLLEKSETARFVKEFKEAIEGYTYLED